ncbi:hypothetical protein HPB48_014791 [Haemaphysalis longicornis]|uniref:Uncharacterized protein n=1 Tax=Haemaphysalis longicornis TaxID=44386 RepID=A0A9J6GGY3_HAELO|nr:hypothetical protein HPB48_014791 [Haemaphysalis longicornis]
MLVSRQTVSRHKRDATRNSCHVAVGMTGALAWLGSGTGNKALWRTFQAMERSGSLVDPSASIRLALNISPEEFADRAAVSFFPNHQQPPAASPSAVVLDESGITEPFTMAELIAAIEESKAHSSPGYDEIPYELFKNLEGEALDAYSVR